MARNNDKPFDCKNCRFNISGECRRNPPTAIANIDSVDYEYQSSIQAQFPPADSGCFAGEPNVQRSCATCAIRATINCPLNDEVQYPFCSPKGWHCSDWSAKGGGKQ
jgi:hypothetical protein